MSAQPKSLDEHQTDAVRSFHASSCSASIVPGCRVMFKTDDVLGIVSHVAGTRAHVEWIGFRYNPSCDGWHPLKNLRLAPNA